MKQRFTPIILFALLFSIPSFAQSVVNSVEAGTALYYADYLEGRRTASGEIFNQREMTCAHKTLPFGTWVRVTRMDNQRSVTVRVNDRGPFCEGCVVDLSKAAAAQIDLLQSGKAQVKVEALGYTEPALNQPINANQLTERGGAQTPQGYSNYNYNSNIPRSYGQVPSSYNTVQRQPANVSASTDTRSGLSSWEQELLAKSSAQMRPRTYSYSSPNTLTARSPANTSAVGPPANVPSSYSWTPTLATKGGASSILIPSTQPQPTAYNNPTNNSGYGVQVASYANYDNADKRQRSVYAKGVTNVFIKQGLSRTGAQVYRVVVGPFNDKSTAATSLQQLKRTYALDGFVVDLNK